MKETKTVSGNPEARAAMHEMMAAFEAFKGANDARLGEIEKKAAADVLLEEKVARLDQAVASAQARLDRVMSQSRRPAIGGEPAEPVSAPEAKAAWDGYLKTGQSGALEVKAGLSGGATSGGYVVPYETERAIERRLMTEVGCAAVDRRPDGARRRGRRAARCPRAGRRRRPGRTHWPGSRRADPTASRSRTDRPSTRSPGRRDHRSPACRC
jgi:hypothetical protein